MHLVNSKHYLSVSYSYCFPFPFFIQGHRISLYPVCLIKNAQWNKKGQIYAYFHPFWLVCSRDEFILIYPPSFLSISNFYQFEELNISIFCCLTLIFCLSPIYSYNLPIKKKTLVKFG